MELDIGCGLKKKLNCIGVDIVRQETVDVVASATNLPFKTNSIDFIFSRRCLQHIRDEKIAITEMHRVLRDGGGVELIVAGIFGWLYYWGYFFWRYGNYSYFHLYIKTSLRRKLYNAGFRNVTVAQIRSTRLVGYDLSARGIK